MSRKSALEASASALAQPDVVAAPVHAGQIADALGDSASTEAIERLKRATQHVKNVENAKLLSRAINAVHAHDFKLAQKLALKLLKKDEMLGLAWHILGIASEKLGDYGSSLRAYDAALKLLADHGPVAGDLGRLAFRMNMPEFAVGFFAHFRLAQPDNIEASNNLACALRELNRESEAIDVLKTAIADHPESPALWNTLGTVVCNRGDAEGSIVFFDEALRLEPAYSKAWHNRAFARSDMGDIEGALSDIDQALKRPDTAADEAIMRFARSTMSLSLGRLAEGWKEYDARFSSDLTEAPNFNIPGKPWTGEDLKGKSLMICTEQGLGDEVMFANMLPDILELLGPDGSLTLAVERRLIPLFQRSFPNVEVTVHRTVKYEGRVYRAAPEIEDWSRFDYWSPLGAFLRQLRGSIDAFPKTAGYLKADPARVAHWKSELAKLGDAPKVGLLWKSLKLDAERARQFSPFGAWRPVLETPGVSFVNLQYGDCEAEIAYAKSEFGVDIWQPPGIDLKQDLDDVTALCASVDLIIGFSNATTNLAGAAGAPIWMLTAPAAWTLLGSDHYPWYPQARIFSPNSLANWNPAMDAVAQALREMAARQG
ncbi:tetratricopeptide repeat protein [Caulobacter segnis]|uniref:Flagellar protein FlbA n=1 Tax=Caulobacter segnis TaxID=88688 RepID=A0A2W5V144_9CAUL|nr:tetratricopeptide repeat protein [Caulobacter segnis]PZR33580.1 MAG: flagellar protein FlbA [Caulobacter segnis]